MTEDALDRCKTAGWIVLLLAAGIAINSVAVINKAPAQTIDRHGAHAWQPTYTNETLGTYRKRAAKHRKARHAKPHVRAHVRRVVNRPAQTAATSAAATPLVAEARRYLGGNPTGRGSLWCADFMNLVLERSGLRGTGSRLARSFASYGAPVAGPQVGAIAVMSRGRRGGHVGIVTAVLGNGRIVLLSGNDGRAVRERPRTTAGVFAYRLPTGLRMEATAQ